MGSPPTVTWLATARPDSSGRAAFYIPLLSFNYEEIIALQIPSKMLDFILMKKKHTYNWLICLGLFMPKPKLA